MGDHQLADIEEYDIGKSGMTYLFMKDKPLYRFGYGLKFSNFECELKDSKVRIKNTGKYTSDCTVQLYEAPDGKLFLYDGSDRYGLDVNGQQIPVGSKLAAFDRVHDVKPGDELIIDVNI